jgi:hypothetical protein
MNEPLLNRQRGGAAKVRRLPGLDPVGAFALWESMNVLGRMGTVEEFAAAGHYLLSHEGAYRPADGRRFRLAMSLPDPEKS